MILKIDMTKYDCIAGLHVGAVIFSYLWFWNASLCDWLTPGKDRDTYFDAWFDMFMVFALGIILAMAWFVIVGGISGMFSTFEWCDKHRK